MAAAGSGARGLERFKGAVYIVMPVLAVVFYSQPQVHEWALRRSRYVVYPAPKQLEAEMEKDRGVLRRVVAAGRREPAAAAAAAAAGGGALS